MLPPTAKSRTPYGETVPVFSSACPCSATRANLGEHNATQLHYIRNRY